MKYLKSIAVLIMSVIIFVCCFKDSLASKIPKTNPTPILEAEEVDNYLADTHWLVAWDEESNMILSPLDTASGRYQYGVHITFDKEKQFREFYTAPCGNDNFFATSGNYKLIEGDKIVLVTDSTQYWGMRKNRTEKPKEKDRVRTLDIEKRRETFVIKSN